MKIDIEKERAFLQAIFVGPRSTELEHALFEDIVGKGSEPIEWSPETVESAHYMRRVYEMGWGAGKRNEQVQLDTIQSLRADGERLRGLILKAIDCWWPFVHGAIGASMRAKNLFGELSDGIQGKGEGK